MHTRVLATLDYPEVLHQLASYTVSDAGKRLALALTPDDTAGAVQENIDRTADAMALHRLKGGYPITKTVDITPHLKRLQIGATLSGSELAQIGRVLAVAASIKNFFSDFADDQDQMLRALPDLVDQLVDLPAVTRALNRALDEDGTVLDTASSKLQGIRTGMRQTEGAVRTRLEQYTRGKEAQYLTDAIITLRDDRYVIPVKAEYKNRFGGIVHDQSASGQTFYIEPQAVLEMNNRLRQLQIDEKREIERILAELAELVAPYTNELKANADILAELDLVNAKAQYARAINATEPIIDADRYVDLIQARHPLIDPKKVVPNDIYLGKDFHTIVVTGPNTGGKTITLKTLGLLELMAQSGMFIPANEDSHVAIYDEILADIGDEQSIEQSLSTFSGHMKNIISILHVATKRSLVLFDELGAGTDPQEGASLAIAVLDYLGAMGPDVVATTHYPELKVYGYNTPQTINASMEFDITTLQPTYRLLIGTPGRSNAFDIAARLGLNQEIVDRAKQLLDGESQNLNEMIGDLENQRKAAETEYHELRHQLDEATTLHEQLNTAFEEFLKDKDTQLQKAQQQADKLVDKAQAKADKIIADLRQAQLTGSGSSVKEDKLIAARTALKDLHSTPSAKNNRVLRREKKKQTLRPGDDVQVASYGTVGTLLSKSDDTHWEVQLGILKMKVPTDELTKVEAPEDKEPKRHIVNVSNRGPAISPTLDLRGKRYEEAMHDLDQYMDEALLANYPTVTIIHGKGTGAIRNGVQEYLKQHRQIKSYKYAPPEAGGDGATIVVFK
ncbi:endonuclease MutS2 [Schleiferilactobacillus harbinensis]|jgi:DNA mismatch repair protein MutS2|uniref:Endonuclease MutS2 n=1 Tax=Schleiferilactobacillus harbinensis TaxID=304207 RepID=A0ABU7SYM4_9LACO|nr:endonuclease MutS2 [Schleiferilactobacillus harbinensis]MCI1688714.1 endonuclease MutS2 [Schleiferilactobacillus harbinensis]MCI1850310.1 endonuclease MutS2 [Schleiferilactobacillus harbinensis]